MPLLIQLLTGEFKTMHIFRFHFLEPKLNMLWQRGSETYEGGGV